MSRRSLVPGVIAVAIASVMGMSARADDAQALKDRLHGAEKDTTLSGDDVQPFYLKMSVQLFDAKGKPSEQGTVEVFWRSPNQQKRVYAFPSYTATEVHDGGKTFRTADAKSPPETAALVVDQMLHPMAKPGQIDASTPQMQKVTLGKASLDCIMLAMPIGGSAPIPMGLFPTYCLDAGSSVLRVTSNYGGEVILRNLTSTFQQRHVAMDVIVSEKQVEAAEGKLEKLEQREVADADLTINGLLPVVSPTKIAAGVIAGFAISKPDPVYPAIARAQHVQGTVILHAIIAKDGHIQELKVISSPDPNLSIAALDSVRQWRYKPYTLLGEPVEVDTTIQVNFAFGR